VWRIIASGAGGVNQGGDFRSGFSIFHTLFYLMVSASGVEIQTEVLTGRGRIDLVVEFPDKVFVIEFKCNQKPQVGLQQIQDQGYAERYQKSGKRVFLMGLEFSTEQSNLVAWQVQAPD
jgi:hypothetical protein